MIGIELGWRRQIRCRTVRRARRDNSGDSRPQRRGAAAERDAGPGELKSAPAAEHRTCHALSDATYRAIYNSLDMYTSATELPEIVRSSGYAATRNFA